MRVRVRVRVGVRPNPHLDVLGELRVRDGRRDLGQARGHDAHLIRLTARARARVRGRVGVGVRVRVRVSY